MQHRLGSRPTYYLAGILTLGFATLAGGVEPRKDTHGDPLPLGAIARLGSERFRHVEAIMALAFAPDGKQLFGVAHQEGLRVWDATNGAIIQDSLRARGLLGVAFSSDGKTIALAIREHRLPLNVLVAKVETGARLWEHELDRAKGNDEDWWDEDPVALAFAPNGNLVAVGRPNCEVVVFDAATGDVRFKGTNHKLPVTAVQFSPHLTVLASASEDRTICLWDVATGKEKLRMEHGTAGGVGNVAFTPDGQTVVSIGMGEYRPRRGKSRGIVAGDDKARLWDVATGRQVREWHVGSRYDVSRLDLVFTPDGKTVAIHLGDTVGLWSVASGEQVGRLPIALLPLQDWKGGIIRSASHALAFTPDGRTLAAGFRRTVRLFDVATRQAIHLTPGHQDRVRSMAFADDGRSLVSECQDGELRVWDVDKGVERVARRVDPVFGFSPDGRLAVVRAENSFNVVETATDKTVARLPFQRLGMHSAVAFAADGKTLGVATGSGEVRTWRLPEGQALVERRLELAKDTAHEQIALASDLSKVATAGRFKDPSLFLWDVATGKSIARIPMPGHFGFDQFTFSPNAKLLAARSFHNHRIRLYDATTGEEQRVLEHQALGGGGELVFSPDGKMLASGGFRALLWDVLRGKPMFQVPSSRHDGRYFAAMAFSRDGKRLATAYDGGTILVWDVVKVLKDEE